ncbi:MAG: DUF1653 domain-containing protein [Lachnospiraceae bacterium]|jgi:hypothetical protein|nr:DUF1653 domain-containing protein [Lachnospiraceae bacterium]
MREVRQGQFYRHFKDRLYQVMAVAEHSETGERMVVYQALYGDYRVYVRPYEMFISEVDHEKYPQVTQRYRFEQVELSGEECPDQGTGSVQEAPCGAAAESKEESAVQKRCPESPSGDGSVNPILLEFLDAETLEEKLHIMIFGRNQMDDSLLNSIAISLDLVVDEKSTQEKYDEILNCLSMMEKFECNRLR